MRRVAGLIVVSSLLAAVPSVAAAAPDSPDPGRTTHGTITSNGNVYPYLLYTPASYRPRRAEPLVVMIHGCQTTAAQEQKVTLFDKLAERKHFVVLYPDGDAADRTQPGPLTHCWKFWDPSADKRGNGDAAAIVDMTRAVMRSRAIDGQRVFAVGVSAGGLLASIEAAAYPDVFAAVGIVESAGYADWPCFTTGVGIPVTLSAQSAFAEMGPRARIVPRFVIGSTGDLAFPASCAKKALEQGLRTDNLVISASQTTPIPLAPATVKKHQKPGGYGYTVNTYSDPTRCLIGELTIINGMPHAWPGGTTDSAFAGYSDPKAPSGAQISWAFFSRYAKRQTSMPCATARARHTPRGRRSRASWKRR